MYSPPEFTPIIQLNPTFESMVEQFLPSQIGFVFGDHKESDETERLRRLRLFLATSDALLINLQMRVLIEQPFEVFLCNSKKELIKASPLLFSVWNTLHWCDWEFPPDPQTELWAQIDAAIKIGKPPFPYFANHYWFFDYPTGCLFDRTEDLQEYGFLVEAKANGYDRAFQIASEFFGWCVCVRTADVPPTIQDFRVLMGLPNFDSPAMHRTGRPRKQEDARVAYELVYPHGHGSETYKEVLRNLEASTGIKVSERTLRRAFEKANDD